ncbi:hypothetical protein KAR91_73230 [Candidatus Pacearchaeota archaeon]|nr:hypothetical protein [Candidatus Pacearchaeota archaeon]
MNKKTSQQKTTSANRLMARAAEKKLQPAIKHLSEAVRNTTELPKKFIGYKLPGGELIDNKGVHWQLQVHAVVSKKHIIKKNELTPVFEKWAISIHIKAWIKYALDTIFS